MTAADTVKGLMCCAYMTQETCKACPYGDDVPASCYQLRHDGQALMQRLQDEEMTTDGG